MEDYSFYERTPADAVTDFEISLFNMPQYLFLGAAEGWITFYALHNRHQRIDAILHVHLEAGIARSPIKAPFGGVEYASRISPLILFQFLEFAESRLRSKDAKTLIIKSPTFHYQESSLSLLHVFLLNRGFTAVDAEVGCVVDLREDFLKTIDTWEHRKLRQAEESGLQFRILPVDHLDEIYLFILACRKKKNYSLSMTLAEVRKVIMQFPDRYVLCGVFEDGKLIAGSIAVHVNSRVLYNFYSDHDTAFDHLSPVVFLIRELVRYADGKTFRWLDLGTAAREGAPNFGLLDFKLRLGGKPTEKLTFRKSLV